MTLSLEGFGDNPPHLHRLSDRDRTPVLDPRLDVQPGRHYHIGHQD
jgi:hypothetical protein